MFEIDRAPYEVALDQANAALAQERAKLSQATRDEVRFRDLVADKAVSQKDYDDALSQKDLGAAAVQQAEAKVREAKLNLSYTLVAAPVAGISGRAQRSVGSLVTTDASGSLLTTINQLNPIWVRFSLAETDLATVPGGKLSRGTAIVALTLADGTAYPIQGRLNFAASEIDTRLGTQQLRAEFDNPHEDLVPGQFVRVHITAGRRDNVFLVPQAAVMQTEKGYFVFVVGSDGKATERPVETGAWIGSDWTIRKGLAAGDRVIIDNLLRLKPGLAVAPTPVSDAAATPAPAPAPGTVSRPPAGAAKY
jgi:membrane fusion protein (multidrug efflux system)